MSINSKSYGQSFHRQLLRKEENQEKHYVTACMTMATYVMFTKIKAKVGIKKFGEQTISAIFKEFKQLNNGSMPGNPFLEPSNQTDSLPEKGKELLKQLI